MGDTGLMTVSYLLIRGANGALQAGSFEKGTFFS
jgi:hypothetical protein